MTVDMENDLCEYCPNDSTATCYTCMDDVCDDCICLCDRDVIE